VVIILTGMHLELVKKKKNLDPVGERPPPRLSNKKELSVPRAEKTPEPWPRPDTRSGHRRYLGRCRHLELVAQGESAMPTIPLT
jgi:hypothetical protein